MLTVTRKEGESIILEPTNGVDPGTTIGELLEGGRIEITVLGRGRSAGSTRICAQALRSISVVRKELQARLSESVESACGVNSQAA